MNWVLVYVVLGGPALDVRTHSTTEAQCKAFVRHFTEVRRKHPGTETGARTPLGFCLSPDGTRWTAGAGK